MRSLRGRTHFVLGLGVVAIPLVVATAVAYACTAVATLSPSPTAAAPGSTVTVSGRFFGTHDPGIDNSNGPAEIRLGSLSGPVLATAAPRGDDRSFSVQVTIPQAAPGDTFIAATQKTPNGTPVYGTPARQTFTVTPAPASLTPAGSPPGPVQPQQVDNKAALAKALARCKAKHNPSKAKTRTGKKRLAQRRAACTNRARNAHS